MVINFGVFDSSVFGPARSRGWTFLGVMMLVLAGLSGCKRPSVGYNDGYEPDQPIAFSHELHAGNYKMQCLYCHSSAEKSKHAGVPSLNVCMNCHLVVATDKPEIQKLTKHYNEGTPVNWVKVHMLPDHAHFNHKRHVARNVACQECHGPVETMAKVKQVSDLSMGWCINCHRKPENNAPISCTTCHY